MNTRIDHFMYGVASLDDGIAWAEDAFCVAPAYGGEHVGLGTRNALLSLGEAYLEIIAPDPAQAPASGLGRRLSELSEGGLLTWAVQGPLTEIARVLDACGVATVGPNRTERRTAEGELLVWELLFPTRTAFGARMPFFIDWLECAHPSATNPKGGEFRSLTIVDPDAAGLKTLLEGIGLGDVVVIEGDPALRVDVETAKGAVTLSSTAETTGIVIR